MNRVILEKHGVANAKRWKITDDNLEETAVNVVDRYDYVGLSFTRGPVFLTADQADMLADQIRASAARLRGRLAELLADRE